MPLFLTKKEVFEWIKQNKKTIEIRKGKPHRGETAVFQSGPNCLRLKIVKKETGSLREIVRLDNYKLIIPSAETLEDAIVYLCLLYGDYEGVFTGYYLRRKR